MDKECLNKCNIDSGFTKKALRISDDIPSIQLSFFQVNSLDPPVSYRKDAYFPKCLHIFPN